MKKIIVWLLVLISLVALVFRFSDRLAELFLGIRETSGISVLSEPGGATVFLDGQEAGKTPFEEKGLEVGDHLIKLEKDKASWEGRVGLSAGTVTVVNRDLSSDSASSAGETLTLNRGKGLTIVSSPSEASVEIEGKSYGNTPVTINIDSGEYTLLVSHQNYLKRSIKAYLPDDFNLIVSVDLALSEADLTATTPTPVITQTPTVLVKQTPTGFLRVRDKPNLVGKEIAQVKPGEILILLEELGAWDRIRLSDGREGYVSTSYVEKKTP